MKIIKKLKWVLLVILIGVVGALIKKLWQGPSLTLKSNRSSHRQPINSNENNAGIDNVLFFSYSYKS